MSIICSYINYTMCSSVVQLQVPRHTAGSNEYGRLETNSAAIAGWSSATWWIRRAWDRLEMGVRRGRSLRIRLVPAGMGPEGVREDKILLPRRLTHEYWQCYNNK